MLSVILPAYNEEKNVPAAAERISQILSEENIPCEIVFIDDGSRDGTWNEIKAASDRYDAVRGLHFSRNFGKEAAMFAGLESARGDCAVVLDTDLQHPPEKIVEMYRLWEQGYEVIEGIKDDRGSESVFHRAAADTFYKWMSRATGVDMSSSSDFKLLDRKVVDALNAMPERHVFFRALSFWVGFKRAEVKYSVQERTAGEIKWSTGALIKYADSVSGDVQELCEAIWDTTEPNATVSVEDIPRALECVFAREGEAFGESVRQLTPLQVSVLRALAELNSVGIFSEEFMERVQTTSTGALRTALKRLVAKRLIYQFGGRYRFSNPFFKAWLLKRM